MTFIDKDWKCVASLKIKSLSTMTDEQREEVINWLTDLIEDFKLDWAVYGKDLSVKFYRKE